MRKQKWLTIGILALVALGCARPVEKKYRQAQRLREAGKLLEAIPLYKEAVQLEPDFAPAQRELGQTYLTLKRYEEAIPHLGQAAQLEPANSTIHLDLGQALWKAGRLGQALQSLERAAELDPADPLPLLYQGQVLLDQSRYAEAQEPLQKALERDPNSAEAHGALASAYALLHRYTEALAHFEKAIALGTPSVNIWIRYGLTLYQLDQMDKACWAMGKAHELDPRNTDALLYLGQFYWQQERWAKVVEAWEALLELTPEDTTTQALLKDARRRLEGQTGNP